MGDGQNTGESHNNNISCNPRNNDIGWITSHIALIWNELFSAWKLRNQVRHGKTRTAPTPNQAGPSQETNTSPISSSNSLQPNQSLQVVMRQAQRTLPS
jgi:hypothetical protein